LLHEDVDKETQILNNSKKKKFVKEVVKIKDETNILEESFDIDDLDLQNN